MDKKKTVKQLCCFKPLKKNKFGCFYKIRFSTEFGQCWGNSIRCNYI